MDWQNVPKTIFSQNLTLKIVSRKDAQKLLELRTNEIVDKYIKRDLNQNISDIHWFIEKMNSVENKTLFYTIKRTSDKEFLGTICLWRINEEVECAEVGYELFPEFQGQKIMNEALQTIINLSFKDIGFNYLIANTDKDNLSSRKLLEKNNFIFQPEKKDYNKPNNVVYEFIKAFS